MERLKMVIEATSRQIKTMTDGTLRLTVDIPPASAQDAFKLFGAPDVPMVLARLTPGAAQKSARETMIAADKPKGGELARLAGMWCQEIQFYEFIRPVYDKYMGGDGSGTGDIEPDNGDVESYCRHCILVMCGVESRAELDHNTYVAKTFHELIRIPYSEWLKKHGG